MTVFDAAGVLRRAWWVVAISVLFGAAAGAGISRLSPPMYTSSSQMFLAARSDASASELAAGSNYMKLQIASYPSLITSQTVLRPVIKKLKLKTSPEALAGDVVVDVPTNQMWLIVTVRNPNAAQAQKISAAISTESKAAISRLEARGSDKSPVTVTIVSKGSAPLLVPRNGTMYTVGGGMLGLILAVALVMLRWALRDARRRSIDSGLTSEDEFEPDDSVTRLDIGRGDKKTDRLPSRGRTADGSVSPDADEPEDRIAVAARSSGTPWRS